ncbi:YicC/YloC family endoribonuclease [Thermonema rossianum]|uniref:YicC/YloC family endoribonuclease n=1 Tax=Thermonema rossianum TaxID=55505 RepID=UPI00057122CA|nr:YicC/YloC family endoribonuclease [Thermonema rossianum]
MLLSMTGYGRAEYQDAHLYIKVEVKTLNSKYLDLNLRSGRLLNSKEIALRNLIQQKLVRGKVQMSIDFERIDLENPLQLDETLITQAYRQLEALADRLQADKQDLLRLVIQKTENLNKQEEDSLRDEEWQQLLAVVEQAIEQCTQFRRQEGEALSRQINDELDRIEHYLQEINTLDPQRIQHIRERIQKHLQEIAQNDHFDPNRFEQEMIYYIERLDISEEKVRLQNHLQYFRKLMGSAESQGKKLNFLCQEIGREINTIGSKANDAQIQQYVVHMKDALERIKEQVQNIL